MKGGVPSQHTSVRLAQQATARDVDDTSKEVCLEGALCIARRHERTLPDAFVKAALGLQLHDALVAAARHLGDTEDDALTSNQQVVREVLRRWYISTKTVFKQD